MGGQSNYAPPPYIPLGQSDSELEVAPSHNGIPISAIPGVSGAGDSPAQWSSGICACCDDMQSCMLISVLWPWITERCILSSKAKNFKSILILNSLLVAQLTNYDNNPKGSLTR